MQIGFLNYQDGKSMEKPVAIGKFGLGLKVLKYPDGRTEYQIQKINKGIPIQIVIMQIKAFLKNLEKEYFEKFKK